ncbi:unnamed protein product [Mycena citricolor]|uniref:Uncharacterized protein n=1 Tax=Mycena citricolor TaxID=2018698 RepID=A0AAD2H400_9AGAR|nr:unnamed protein product [Mycena citricolor]
MRANPAFDARTPYSSYFLSGLMSPSSSPSSPASSYSFDFPRRGSLPESSSSSFATSAGDDSSFYLAMHSPAVVDKNQYRSFLSLDLAESLSLKSRHARRSTRSQREQADPVPDSPSLLPPSPVFARSSPVHSSRAIPSPKPAPSASLPCVPSPVTTGSQVIEIRISRTVAPVDIRSVPQRKPSLVSQATRASATTSTVSTRYRRKRRNKALACLEGRRPALALNTTGDFMSLSDGDDSDSDVGSPSDMDLSLRDDQLIMLIARLNDGELMPHNASPSAKSSHSHSRKRESSKRSLRRSKTAIGLKSFMDFQNDDESSWGWNSFIEVRS